MADQSLLLYYLGLGTLRCYANSVMYKCEKLTLLPKKTVNRIDRKQSLRVSWQTVVHPFKGIVHADCAGDKKGTGRATSGIVISVKLVKCARHSAGWTVDPFATSQCSFATTRSSANRHTLHFIKFTVSEPKCVVLQHEVCYFPVMTRHSITITSFDA